MENKKLRFIAPEFCVINITEQDVITASGGGKKDSETDEEPIVIGGNGILP